MGIIKENELRLGNWIQSRSDCKKDFVAFQVYKETFFDIESTYGEFIPIPLTREWILNFGFQEKYSEKRIYFRIKGMLIEVKNGSKFYYNNIHLKHVHELQNLFFVLNKKELIIK